MSIYEERRAQYSALQFTAETMREVVALLKRHGYVGIYANFEEDWCIAANDRNGNAITIHDGDYVFCLRTLNPPFHGPHLLTMPDAMFHESFREVEQS